MNFQRENSSICSENWIQDSQEHKVYQLDNEENKLVKIIIQVTLTKDQKIVYQKNGTILRIEQVYDTSRDPEILNYMEQIQHLSWQGQYALNNKKNGKWMVSWDENLIKDASGYYYDGKKQGLWIDLIQNYWIQAQVFETGEYLNDLKIGNWNYICNKNKIGGGLYNKDNSKQGKWIELDEGFCMAKKVIYRGEYNMRGMKVGIWDIYYFKDGENQYKQIGGGSYGQEGQIKIGKWVELDEGFYRRKQVTCSGEYNIKGMKIGRWDICYCKDGEKQYKQIGGGLYDQEGQIKIGKWVELDEGFYRDKQITYHGEYELKGMKIGRWNIVNKGQKIGGGIYSVGNSQIKIGKWTELDEKFNRDKQVIYSGEYNMKGMKIGRWDIHYCDRWGDGEYIQIGGGSYDEGENQIKIGRWVQLDEGFNTNKKVTYSGEYNMKGMKVGRWDIIHNKSADDEFEYIGGGSYDEVEGQLKIGSWVDLWEGFQFYAQVTYSGEYNKKGQKIGVWQILYDKSGDGEYEQIGGGSYDEELGQIKIGRWVELDESFFEENQITYNGDYNMKGKKIGTWVEMDILENKLIGEKIYNN
ncbi:unnamed protein product [Paramecium sonneborni]|uniref:Uncharacterized protein n=1 Tax=Paramecium sonneborni TaxID=65129 RepID=A0A8S1QI11_9CILI|nr:unnamed protein product [Paramecium sonneborni]